MKKSFSLFEKAFAILLSSILLTCLSAHAQTITVVGTMGLGAANKISDASNVNMKGGTFSTGSGAGFSETVGTLTLSATSTIALGTGSHNVNFAASNGTTWTGSTILRVTGWAGGFNGTSGTAGKIFSGSSAELSAPKLAQISFVNDGLKRTATQLSTGEIVPTATLPVELVYFNGESSGTSNHLHWLTASEVNSDYFDVLRSSNAIDFEIIGKQKAAGNSYDFIQYNFDDLNPLKGVNYYKLIEYDFDGSKQNSEIIALKNSSDTIQFLKTYPVPASDQLNVFFSSMNGGMCYLKLLSLEGKELYTAMVTTMIGDNAFKLNLGSYPAGSYIIQLTDSLGERHSSNVVRSN